MSETFAEIPAGSTSTITEPANGSTQSVLVTSALPDPVVIAANTTAAAAVTDSYSFAPGTLLVRKTIAGAAAGAQAKFGLRSSARQAEPLSWAKRFSFRPVL